MHILSASSQSHTVPTLHRDWNWSRLIAACDQHSNSLLHRPLRENISVTNIMRRLPVHTYIYSAA